jgi:hypothetical protein
MHTGKLVSHKEEINHIICRNMDGIVDHPVKQNKPDFKRPISYFFL